MCGTPPEITFERLGGSIHKVIDVLGRVFKEHHWRDPGTVVYGLALELRKSRGLSVEQAVELTPVNFFIQNHIQREELRGALTRLAFELMKERHVPGFPYESRDQHVRPPEREQ